MTMRRFVVPSYFGWMRKDEAADSNLFIGRDQQGVNPV
jgi:hypothetical protein